MHIVLIQNVDFRKNIGVHISLFDICKGFDEEKIKNITLICSGISEQDKKKFQDKGMQVFTTGTNLYSMKGNIKFMHRTWRILSHISRERSIDICHTLYPFSSAWWALIFRIFRRSNLKIIYDIKSLWIEMMEAQSYVSRPLLRLVHAIEGIIARRVDGMVFMNIAIQEYYHKRYSLKKEGVVVPLGISYVTTSQINYSLEQDIRIFAQERIIIGYIGALDASRQVCDFLMKHKWYDFWKVCFVIIGSGDEFQRVEKFIDSEWLQGNILLLSQTSRESVYGAINLFDYGLCHLPDIPVFSASSPLKNLEYLSQGVPVLASSIQTHKFLGEEFPGFVNLYWEYLDFDMLTKRTTRNAPEGFSRRYTSNIIMQYENMYKSL